VTNMKRDPKGYYVALGVDENADADAIKAAFRSKAKRLHPDFNPSPIATKQFHRLHEAYETLGETRLGSDGAIVAACRDRRRDQHDRDPLRTVFDLGRGARIVRAWSIFTAALRNT